MHFQHTHQSPNANSNSQTLLQASQYSTNETANKTIPNPTLKNAEIKADMSSCDNCTATHILTNQGTNAASIANTIITFYSDRNLKERMEFKNPKVEYY